MRARGATSKLRVKVASSNCKHSRRSAGCRGLRCARESAPAAGHPMREGATPCDVWLRRQAKLARLQSVLASASPCDPGLTAGWVANGLQRACSRPRTEGLLRGREGARIGTPQAGVRWRTQRECRQVRHPSHHLRLAHSCRQSVSRVPTHAICRCMDAM